MKQMVMGGLDKRPLAELSALIASSGFNCVRAPFSLDMIFKTDMPVPDPNATLAANPDLKLLAHSPLAIFDETVASLTDHGLLVILNNHVSSSGWCCSIWDGEGLWYTKDYPEEMWLDAMTFMAARYRKNSLVAAFDLRNEIRQSDLGTPTWGDGDLKTDWSIAAEKGSRRVLAEDPDMLVFISGLDFSQYLCDVPRNPIHLLPGLADHLAYTVHYYSWDASIGPRAAQLVTGVQLALGVLCGLLSVLLLLACLLPRRSDWAQWRAFRLLTCDCRREPRATVVRPCVIITGALLSAAASLVFALWPEHSCETLGVLVALRPFRPLLTLLFGAVSLVLGLRWMVASVHRFSCTASFAKEEADLESSAACRGSSLAIRGASCGTRPAPTTGEGQELDSPSRCAQENEEVRSESSAVKADGAPTRDDVKVGPKEDLAMFTMRAPGSPARARAVLRSRLFLAVVLAAVTLSVLLWAWKDVVTYRRFAHKLDRAWGFLLKASEANGTAAPGPYGPVPIWLGEFGTDTDGRYWRNTLRYIREHDVDWAYWAFNGEKYTDVPETFGLFEDDWLSIRQPWKLSALQELINATAGAVVPAGRL